MSEDILQIKEVKKFFSHSSGVSVKSVDGISFSIKRGETLGLVGESGSGKSTLGRTIVGLYEQTEGKIIFEGRDVSQLTNQEKRDVNRKMQMIFQDPHASLNPRMRVEDIISEGMDGYGFLSGKKRKERVGELLEKVGLRSEHGRRFPHEFSGGQRQRIGIARALAVKPSFIVADEPISALDVSIQAQVVNLLEDLQKEEGLTYLFIAHDLAMVKHISDRIGVMYLGKLMELTDSETIFTKPLHPYTQALLSSVPVTHPNQKGQRERTVLGGDPPSPLHPPTGCPFSTRCPVATAECRDTPPEWREHSPGHWVACHLNNL
ncbi:ABC transporter ATP-binding protein [Cytobacillus purgationiresistens]|uniref:Peptide/nickel transport system ATP-binding protein/oligopeptide transport system ATP-binding protein n=1 Tax=Cytobacillus purgationiresistens TaxID=863449 RepID=A0ABU0AS88_9BACI|nr:ABC transporter ATP-binding protein [Cytobacillus purgationiresistens]MDQ0273667.1 peptide/nickel transport system ATP-binding protein/oligopeptide transport system ATP-binding protein [Cytobacillus purgationiresistens]